MLFKNIEQTTLGKESECGRGVNQQHLRLQNFVAAYCEEGLVFTEVEITEDEEVDFGRKILNLELDMLRGDYQLPQRKKKKVTNWTYVCAMFVNEAQIFIHQTLKTKIENGKLKLG